MEEHSRVADPAGLPVRTPQQELKRGRLLEKLEPASEDLFAVAGSEYLSATGAGPGRIRNSGGEER